jgi:bile acid:Na+ symporter, BASS family
LGSGGLAQGGINVDVLVKLLTVTALIAMMLSMGLKVRVEEVVASLRKRRLVATGILANYVLVPAVTIALLYLFNTDVMVSVGFLILAVCPGAPVGPPFTATAKGDTTFATGQTVMLAGLSALLSPVLLSVLLPRLLPANQLQIDYAAIVGTLLVSQMLPLAIGLAIHHFAPKLAGGLAKPLGLVANVLLVAAVVLMLINEYESLATIRARGWVGMLLLLAASLSIGWFSGGPGRATRKALAVITASRNAAVALVIASNNFAATPAVTTVIAFALVSILATLGAAMLFAAIPDPAE